MLSSRLIASSFLVAFSLVIYFFVKWIKIRSKYVRLSFGFSIICIVISGTTSTHSSISVVRLILQRDILDWWYPSMCLLYVSTQRMFLFYFMCDCSKLRSIEIALNIKSSFLKRTFDDASMEFPRRIKSDILQSV